MQVSRLLILANILLIFDELVCCFEKIFTLQLVFGTFGQAFFFFVFFCFETKAA